MHMAPAGHRELLIAPEFRARLEAAQRKASAALLAAIAPAGHWTGELSASALATATAVTALALVEKNLAQALHDRSIRAGLEWLAANANTDGGWGDTVRSLSNLSTTALCWAAFGAVPEADQQFAGAVQNAEAWLAAKLGVPADYLRWNTTALAQAIIARYGKDRTFSVPILTMCALAGRLGQGRDAWRQVIPLPFELAACPHQWFAALRLPVVSYALPALIAVGQARFVHAPPRNPLTRLIRILTRQPTLAKLGAIQPSSGGFLEATPLTSFVVLSLAGSGQVDNEVVRRGVEFLLRSQRSDGSWPIDTNLATWVTTLSVNALGGVPALESSVAGGIRDWLLHQQYRAEHPYTHAAPGGWAWTDLAGGVPDADDTSGALLALRRLGPVDGKTRAAGVAGVRWLLGLQNKDGGIPTFCRGWGTLPFDRSSADLTGHALRAWLAWLEDLEIGFAQEVLEAAKRSIGFLAGSQRADGSWAPLWFGNQFAPDEENPLYGTAKVLLALAVASRNQDLQQPELTKACRTGLRWLVQTQNADGGWGGAKGVPSSVEETALASEALAAAERSPAPGAEEALARGLHWLVERIESGAWTEAAPIGFYFAKLWYWERLYPLVFTVGALRRSLNLP